MDILNDVEQAAVQKFNDFETMREAVKKVLLASVYSNGILKPGEKADALKNFAIAFVHQNPGATDEQVGRKLRAQYEGLMKIEEAFQYMAEIKKVEKKDKEPNKAR